jgi:putative tryptophan/tyrosine transport system substrate-binding protein
MRFEKFKRREFIAAFGAAAVWPLVAHAQQPALPVVGILGVQSADVWTDRLRIFRDGLSEAGFVEGRNVAFEYRWLGGGADQYDRLPALAADLVSLPVKVIVPFAGDIPALIAKAATSTIPIVFIISGDPVQSGLVANLNRPGANLTGVTTLNVEVGPKRLEILHELLPRATMMGVLLNPNLSGSEAQLRQLTEAAGKLGLRLQALYASTDGEIDNVFAALAGLHIDGLVVGIDSFLIGRNERIAVLALQHKVPVVWQYREFAAVGGLISYGGLTDGYRLAGNYTGRILKGEKPADLPVQQVTRIELIVNMKTAKALGLTIPISILGRADEVIE